MAVGIGTTNTLQMTGTPTSTTYDQTVTIDSGSNRMLIVNAVAIRNTSNDGDHFVSCVLDPGGGNEATLYRITADFSQSTTRHLASWILLDTDMPSSGSYTMRITIDSTSALNCLYYNTYNFYNVDQYKPIRALSGRHNAVTSLYNSFTIGGHASGDLIVSALVLGDNVTMTPDTGMTELDNDVGAGGTENIGYACAYTTAGGTGLITHGWTTSTLENSEGYILALVENGARDTGTQYSRAAAIWLINNYGDQSGTLDDNDIWQLIDEATASDSDQVQSQLTPTNAAAGYIFYPVYGPLETGDVTTRVRYRDTDSSGTDDVTGWLYIETWPAQTYWWTGTSRDTTYGYTQYNETVSQPTMPATGYPLLLSVRSYALETGTTGSRVMHSWIQLEFPAATTDASVYNESGSDAPKLTDAGTEVATMPTAGSDASKLTDSAVGGLIIPGTAADITKLTDTGAGVVAAVGAGTESVKFGDVPIVHQRGPNSTLKITW